VARIKVVTFGAGVTSPGVLLFSLGLAALADDLFGFSTTPWFYLVAVALPLPGDCPPGATGSPK